MRFKTIGFVALVTGCAGILYLALIVIIANPYDWFFEKSELFDENRFSEIAQGERISEVVANLGESIRIEPYESRGENSGYRIYHFLGEPPAWLVGYKQAWVLVDERGRVIRRDLVVEP